MDIGQDILNTTPLGPLQTSLLEHISKLYILWRVFDPSRIQIFTPLLKKSHGDVQQGADMLCIERSEAGIVTRHVKGNHTWHVMMENGQHSLGGDHEFRQHVFPVVDNGGRIIGGFPLHCPHLSR